MYRRTSSLYARQSNATRSYVAGVQRTTVVPNGREEQKDAARTYNKKDSGMRMTDLQY